MIFKRIVSFFGIFLFLLFCFSLDANAGKYKDFDTGAGTDNQEVFGLVIPGSGGATSVSVTNPIPINIYSETISEKITSQDLSAAVLDYTTDYAAKVQILGIYIHSSVAISETITLKLNSNQGTNYDSVLTAPYTMSSESYYSFRPQDLVIGASDEIDIDVTAGGGTGTVYVLVRAKVLN